MTTSSAAIDDVVLDFMDGRPSLFLHRMSSITPRLLAITVIAVVTVVAAASAQPAVSDSIPLDPHVLHGQLDNGLTYYILENRHPEHRAELRLVVNAGSVLEDEDQRGLAHLVEHMAFNGTTHFKKGELVSFLESVGIRFGADLNAFTGFDETVYMLQVPTDTARILSTGIQVLEDWAHGLLFDDEEIDKERGVVREEWRLGRGADERISDKQFPVLLKGSRYAERLPIGQLDVIEHAPHDVLRRFYRDWYRPDLMAVVIVGDFDAKNVERMVRDHFSNIPMPASPRPRRLFDVQTPDSPRVAVVTDPEQTRWDLEVDYMIPKEPHGTVGDFRKSLVEQLYSRMFNSRLGELRQRPDAPFLYASGSRSGLARTVDFYTLRAAAKEGHATDALRSVFTEAERVRRFGFTNSEFERAKTELLRSIEQSYDERDKSGSGGLTWQFVGNYLDGSPAPGIDRTYQLYKQLVPTITVGEVNALSGAYMSSSQPVVLLGAPEKKDVPAPRGADLLAVIDSVRSMDLKPWVDAVSDKPLIAAPLEQRPIVGTDSVAGLGITKWTLANGVTVYVKPTDFKNDQVLVTAFSPGGTSLVADSDFVNASFAASIVGDCGLGSFDEVQLQKKLAGKVAYVSPYIAEREEGLSGSASPKDLSTLMQLIYLTFTSPRIDSDAFASFVARGREAYRNRSASPESAFSDTLQVTFAGHNIRRMPRTEETYDKLRLNRAFNIYRDRFSDAGDFTFVFVGSVTPEQLRPLVETYLANLPSSGRTESPRDIIVPDPQGIIEKTVRRGIEPKSEVAIVFSDTLTSADRMTRSTISAMCAALDIRLRNLLREDKSGTYYVRVQPSTDKYPRPEYSVRISFGCAPDRVDELSDAVFQQIEQVKAEGFTSETVEKVRKIRQRSLETARQENWFWLSRIEDALTYHEPVEQILDDGPYIEAITPDALRTAVLRYLDPNDHVRVVLVPQESTVAGKAEAQ